MSGLKFDSERYASIAGAFESFAAATPELLERRGLQRRIDSKFLVPVARIPEIVGGLGGVYAAITVPTGKLATYQNLYFDTPDLRSYRDHLNSRRLRQKVRIRSYLDREVAFVEVKTRRNDLVTEKYRKRIPFGTTVLDDEQRAFVATHCAYASELTPTLHVDYLRISLVGLVTEERATIDLALTLDNERDSAITLGEVAIVEVKQGGSARTPIFHALRDAGIRELSISKYASAIALLNHVPCNRLRPALRALDKLSGGHVLETIQ